MATTRTITGVNDGSDPFTDQSTSTSTNNSAAVTNVNVQAEGILGVDGALLVEHTAIAADDHALEIVLDAAGFGDVKALDIDYITGDISTGEDEGIILVNIDESLSTGGTVVGLEVIATAVGGAAVDALLTGVGVNPIKQLAGSFGNASSVLNNATNVLTAVSVGGAGNI